MFEEISKGMYLYILEAEYFLMSFYKLDPFQFMRNITTSDLRVYIDRIQMKIKKERDSINKKDFEKALVSLRDILNFITLGKDGIKSKI